MQWRGGCIFCLIKTAHSKWNCNTHWIKIRSYIKYFTKPFREANRYLLRRWKTKINSSTQNESAACKRVTFLLLCAHSQLLTNIISMSQGVFHLEYKVSLYCTCGCLGLQLRAFVFLCLKAICMEFRYLGVIYSLHVSIRDIKTQRWHSIWQVTSSNICFFPSNDLVKLSPF